jgi:hypothetical protein
LLTTGCPHFLQPVVVGGERVVWGCGVGADVCGGGARAGPAAGRVAQRSSPAQALPPFPVLGRSSLWTMSCCWGGWLVLLLRGCNTCHTVGGGLQSGATLISVRLDVWSLPPSSSLRTVTGCRLGGFPVRRDWWGGERIVGGVLPRISIGTWGLCARVFGGEEEGGGVRSGPGEARTIPLFHTISARPPKQPCMVRTLHKVYMLPRLAYALWCRGY